MNKFEVNPFNRGALRPSDVKLLAGRDSELKDIRYIVRYASRQHRFKSIMLSGSRGTGKTSLLNIIEGECISSNLIPVRINLTGASSENTSQFFWLLFTQLINKLFTLGYFGGPDGQIANSIQDIIADKDVDKVHFVFRMPVVRKNYLIHSEASFDFSQFIEDLKLCHNELTNSTENVENTSRRFVFLVDESQQIYSNREIIQHLRILIQQDDLGVGFVFAGDQSYSTTTWESVFGGSTRDFNKINLDNFNDPDAVIEYFKKSLQSIGWTDSDIKEKYFYRFHKACVQIFQLTSGRPAWINTIAEKMFERCMKGESSELKFDKLAQNDIKELLESSKEIDKSKLSVIEQLSPIHKKWLSDLFDCEYSTFSQVYEFSKLKYSCEDVISKKAYENLCRVC